ncbi:MAG: hypothetical protein QM676_04055 [Novosphingobium sp.]
MISSYPCPGGDAEYTLAFDRGRSHRLLIVPALFEEANRMRRLTVEVMRRLDAAGIDCFLPDLPGCNESLQPLEAQTVATWRAAMAAAAAHFGATHALGIRGGTLLQPDLPGWSYGPVKGANLLRQMLRARIVVSREAGLAETQESLLESGGREGLELVGYRMGPGLLAELQTAVPAEGPSEVLQDLIGGSGLWLRAEPGEDRAQADALAAIVAVGIEG